MYDIAVIGCGPAGLSAAINSAQRNKKAAVFGRGIEASLLYSAKEVDNYLGLPKVSGGDMLKKFYEHALEKGVEFLPFKVSQILPMGEYFAINTGKEFFEAKAVILATGIIKSKAIPGEEKLLGKGVSYCATCDGMLYRGKTVIVIGENKDAEEEAEFLSGICGKVYYIPLYSEALEIKGDNIEIVKAKITEVKGEEYVTGIITENGEISADGVFFIKESFSPASLVPGLETEKNVIKVDRKMETSIPGIYAAGDCTGEPYQVAKAVGEGLTAALSASKSIK